MAVRDLPEFAQLNDSEFEIEMKMLFQRFEIQEAGIRIAESFPAATEILE